MASDSPIDRAKADRSEIEKKINSLEMEKNRLENQLMLLYSDRNRIDAFIDLSTRYSTQPTEGHSSNGETALDATQPRARTRRSRLRVERKPKGVPTTPDMVREAIQVATLNGKRGAAAGDLLAFVRGKYWPSAMSKHISPVAWRMWKDGDLRKSGDRYSLLD